MKVQLTEDFTVDGVQRKAGAVVEVRDLLGKILVSTKSAKAVAPATAPGRPVVTRKVRMNDGRVTSLPLFHAALDVVRGTAVAVDPIPADVMAEARACNAAMEARERAPVQFAMRRY